MSATTSRTNTPLARAATAAGNLLRAIIVPRKFFTNATTSTVQTTAVWGAGALLVVAIIILTIAVLIGQATWNQAIGEYLAGNELDRADFPAMNILSGLPYEFPGIWLALIALMGVVRFWWLALLGEKRGGALVMLGMTLSLAAISLTPMMLNGLFAAVTGNLFPIGSEYNSFEAMRIFLAIAGVVIAWLWDGYVTFFAYRAVFQLSAIRAVLTFLIPWGGLYLLTFIV